MSKLSKIIQGKKAKVAGDVFEHALHTQALNNFWQVIKLPMGARMLNAHKMIRVRTDFDFVFAKQQGKIIFADAKSTDAKAFGASKITPHQLRAILGLHRKGYMAGYIVNFKHADTTVWFNAEQLYNLQPGKSLKPHDGVVLGTSNRIDLDMIFNNATSQITVQVLDV